MRANLFHIGDLTLHSYTAAFAIAFVVCSVMALYDAARHRGLYGSPMYGAVILLSGLVGAHFTALWQADALRPLWRVFFLWDGGMAFYGGLTGAFAAGMLYVLVRRWPLLQTADVAAPYLALGEAIIRIGCFLGGCCWGTVCALPWAVQFPRFSDPFRYQVREGILEASAAASLPVHPTQLYLVAGLLPMFFLLRYLMVKRMPDGGVVLLYTFMHGCLRFNVDFFRANVTPKYGPFSTSQVLSLILIAGSVTGFFAWRMYHGKRAQADAPVTESSGHA